MLRVGFMVVAEDCHNHCVFCDATRLGTGRILPRIKALDQLSFFIDSGISELVISGGEPLHHPDLVELIQQAKSSGVERVSIYTTACFEITKYNPTVLLDAGADCFMVSLFGPDRRIHSAVARNKDAFDQTIRGLDALAQAGALIVANSPVMRANYDRLDDMLNILAQRSVKVWQLSDIHPTTAVLENTNVHVDYAELEPILQNIIRLAHERGIEILTQEYPLCVMGENYTRTQEICRAWYTTLLTESSFSTGKYITIRPISAPDRVFFSSCEACSLKQYCRGIPDSYMRRYPGFETKPLIEPTIESIAQKAARSWLISNRMIH